MIALHISDSPADILRQPSRTHRRWCPPLRRRTLSFPGVPAPLWELLMCTAPLPLSRPNEGRSKFMKLMGIIYAFRPRMSRGRLSFLQIPQKFCPHLFPFCEKYMRFFTVSRHVNSIAAAFPDKHPRMRSPLHYLTKARYIHSISALQVGGKDSTAVPHIDVPAVHVHQSVFGGQSAHCALRHGHYQTRIESMQATRYHGWPARITRFGGSAPPAFPPNGRGPYWSDA